MMTAPRSLEASLEMAQTPFFLVPIPGDGLNTRMMNQPLGAMAAESPANDSFETLLQAVGDRQDRKAFITLFNHFAPRVKSFLMKKGETPGQAEELAQETMLSVWNKASGFDPKQANASTWIFTIARNKRIDHLRKATRITYSDSDPAFVPDNESPAPDSGLIEQDRVTKIAAAIKALPKEQSDLIHKSFFEDKTHMQIAEETHIPLGTVKSRLRLAMDRLHHILGKDVL